MSFLNQHLATILVTKDLGNLQSVIMSEEPDETASGFDSLVQTYFHRNDAVDSVLDLPTNALPNRGTRLTGRDMFVTSRQPRKVGDGLFTIRIGSMGFLSPRGGKVSYSAAPMSQTGENVLVNGVLYSRVMTQENVPVVELEEIVIGEVKSSIVAGVQESPPASIRPDEPTTVWNFLTNPTLHFPNTWVKMSVGAIGLPGVSGVWIRKTRWQWIHQFQP